MRSTWAAAGVGVLLLAGLTTVSAVAGPDDERGRDRAATVSRADADDRATPPPWAQGRKHEDGKGKPDHARKHEWKTEWKAMTPSERQARMDELAKAHAEGMRAFGKCVADAGQDAAKRAECEKPVPPGHAKRGDAGKPGRSR